MLQSNTNLSASTHKSTNTIRITNEILNTIVICTIGLNVVVPDNDVGHFSCGIPGRNCSCIKHVVIGGWLTICCNITLSVNWDTYIGGCMWWTRQSASTRYFHIWKFSCMPYWVHDHHLDDRFIDCFDEQPVYIMILTCFSIYLIDQCNVLNVGSSILAPKL